MRSCSPSYSRAFILRNEKKGVWIGQEEGGVCVEWWSPSASSRMKGHEAQYSCDVGWRKVAAAKENSRGKATVRPA
jgi:hypothetical protein